jgi:hypothetical protein
MARPDARVSRSKTRCTPCRPTSLSRMQHESLRQWANRVPVNSEHTQAVEQRSRGSSHVSKLKTKMATGRRGHRPRHGCKARRQLPNVIGVEAQGGKRRRISHLRRQEADVVVRQVEAAQAGKCAYWHWHLIQVVA